jgi:hypothetical protein
MDMCMLAFVGGTPLGGPVIGWITSAFRARAGMAVCGLVPVVAAVGVAVALRLRAVRPAR